MKDNNEEILDEKIKELNETIEKSQNDLILKFQKYVEDNKYDKEIETLKKLCQKIMDLYQLNKKEIERIDKVQKKFSKDGKEEISLSIEKELEVLQKKNEKQFEAFRKEFDKLTVRVKELTPVQKMKKIILKILESKKELEEKIGSEVNSLRIEGNM